ncbi:hypothetical protein TNCV_4494041 [Trichonephila clavipes]|nr:hypothetical protein TNCV_4494041 [Trichonephila clavipes]
MKIPPWYSPTSESVGKRTSVLIGGVASSESDDFGCVRQVCVFYDFRLMRQAGLMTLVAAPRGSDDFACCVKSV